MALPRLGQRSLTLPVGGEPADTSFMNPHANPTPPSDDPRDTSGTVHRTPYYWELTDEEVDMLRRDNLILEDEGYLAHDLRWGRALLDLRLTYEPVPDLDRAWEIPELPERFSDAISAILQVAVSVGLDAASVCDAAQMTQRGTEHYSASAAVSRRCRKRTDEAR